MAHEIEKNDQVLLTKERAWHGMGVVVPEHLTPSEAVKVVFPWWAEERDMFVRIDGKQTFVEGLKLLLRSDDKTQLGVVSSKYHTIQPQDMADFAEALLEDNVVRVETAGSIRGGKKIWMLLRGKEFEVANGDSIFPYILLSNGYDGVSLYRMTPTTIRTVCSNTMHMVVPNFDTGELGQSCFAMRHTSNVLDRVKEAQAALKNYGKRLEETKQFFGALAATDVNSEAVQKFFLESYTADFGPIPENPKDGYETRRREKATSAWNSFTKRFDDERKIAGASAWNMLNAYTGLIQHDRKAVGKNDVARLETRVEQNLFGLNAERTLVAAQRAFRMALAS